MNAVPRSRAAPRADRLWAFVFAGGATGALVRAGFEKTVAPDVGDFPWPTLTVNAIGTFVLAWTATRLALHPNPRERAFLISGFCGGLTTFATMQLELVKLLDEDYGWIALGYAAASVVVGLLAARIAVTHATRSWRGGP